MKGVSAVTMSCTFARTVITHQDLSMAPMSCIAERIIQDSDDKALPCSCSYYTPAYLGLEDRGPVLTSCVSICTLFFRLDIWHSVQQHRRPCSAHHWPKWINCCRQAAYWNKIRAGQLVLLIEERAHQQSQLLWMQVWCCYRHVP